MISGFATTLTTPLGGDEAAMLLYSERVGSGDVPNRDFFSVYGPGSYELLSGLYAGTGPSVWTERGLGVAYHVAIIIGLMIAIYSFGRRAAIVAGISSAALLLWFTPAAYAWLGGIALAVWSIALLALDPSRRWRWALAGVLAGLVPFWRLEMVLLVIATLPLVWRRGRSASAYLLGLAVGSLPTWWHLYIAGASTAQNVFLERLGINAQSVLSHVDPQVWILIAGCLISPVALLVWAITHRETRRVAMALAILCLAALPQALQRIDIFHAIFVACFAVPLLLGLLVTSRRDAFTFSPTILRAAAAIVVTGVVGGSLALVMTRELPVVSNSGRTEPIAALDAPRLEKVLATLHELVPAGDRVFIGPQDMTRGVSGDIQLYHLMPEYNHQFYYNEFAPGVTERRGSHLLADVMSADALVLTWLDPVAVAESLPNIPPGDMDANEVVRANFCLKSEIGLTQVWLKGSCPP